MLISRYELDFEKTYPFFVDHVDWDTTLSKTMMKKINLAEGFFFTYLPPEANFEQLYEFKRAGMLEQKEDPVKFPQFPNSIFYPIPNLNDEIFQYSFEFLKSQNNMIFLEFYNASPKSKYLDWSDENLHLKNEEVYYVLKEKSSLKNIESVIKTSKSIPHSIMLFCKKSFTFERELTMNDFNNICENVFQIATTAYDGEGFVFWEKNEK